MEHETAIVTAGKKTGKTGMPEAPIPTHQGLLKYWKWISIFLVLTGITGFAAMMHLRPEVETIEPIPEAVPVRVIRAVPLSLPALITGFGQAMVVDQVVLSARIDASLVQVNPKLEPGEILNRGEQICRLDDRALRHRENQIRARINQLENRTQEMRITHEADLSRLEIARKDLDLARDGYRRVAALHHRKFSTRLSLDAAAMALNRAQDAQLRLDGRTRAFSAALNQVQARIRENRALLATVLDDIGHCTITAPFTGRVRSATAETGLFVKAGQPLAVLDNEAVLEIHVTVDTEQSGEWLKIDPDGRFRSGDTPATSPSACRIFRVRPDCESYYSPASGHDDVWSGELHRVVRHDEKSRAMVLAVRVTRHRSAPPPSGPSGSPAAILMPGMFCRVEIKGRTMEKVFCLPASAVGYEKTVHVCRENRLTTVPVEVARHQGNRIYIKSGILPDDQVIVSNLGQPVEGTRLRIINH